MNVLLHGRELLTLPASRFDHGADDFEVVLSGELVKRGTVGEAPETRVLAEVELAAGRSGNFMVPADYMADLRYISRMAARWPPGEIVVVRHVLVRRRRGLSRGGSRLLLAAATSVASRAA